ncbi:MAG: TonB-dependent receptor [Chiayiivirga sp.]|jgi:hypothetical protein|nr:TonB-dependent receptor [Chiayiivirga sp.]
MKRNFRVKRLAGALAVLLATSPVYAQTTSASLAGRITGTDGAPLAGATITIVHTPSGTTSRATTDADGRYNSRGLRVGGPYTVTVQKDGFQGEASENVFLLLGETAAVNADLEAAATTALEAVEVVAAAGTSVFSPESMGAGTSVSRQDIEALPSINGNIQDYMRLDPRVAFVDRASGSISAGGQNPRLQLDFTIDGVFASDTFGLEGNNMPTQRQPASMEAIEAIDVKPVQLRRHLPGPPPAPTVNAVTKSGTNEFHGSVYGYDTAMATGSATIPSPARSSTASTRKRPTASRCRRPDGQGSAVLLRQLREVQADRAGRGSGHHAAWQEQRRHQRRPTSREAQSIASGYGFDAGGLDRQRDTDLEEYALKLDWNISDDHRANFRYSNLEQNRKLRVQAPGTGSISLSSYWYTHRSRWRATSARCSATGPRTSRPSSRFRTATTRRCASPTARRPASSIFFGGNRANRAEWRLRSTSAPKRSSMGNSLMTETWDYVRRRYADVG